jgi:RNA polymerase sigma-70 factor (ECF subfamily)
MDGPDTEDVALARGGDDAAFRRLVERHSRAVFQLAFRLTGREADAEDVVQEAFFKAYRELRRFENRSSFGTWLHRIAVNCAYDSMRKRPRFTAEPLGESDGVRGFEPAAAETTQPDRLAYSAEIQRRVARALDLLTPAERAAFVLRHIEGHSLEDVGRELGLRLSATKHSVFRAVQKIRRALAPIAGVTGEETM